MANHYLIKVPVAMGQKTHRNIRAINSVRRRHAVDSGAAGVNFRAGSGLQRRPVEAGCIPRAPLRSRGLVLSAGCFEVRDAVGSWGLGSLP